MVRVKAFPENISFSRKENVFMSLVAFQKNFRKIFSNVWKKRRKRQNLEKLKTKPRRTWTKRRRTQCDIAKHRSR